MIDQAVLRNRLLSRASASDFALLAGSLVLHECPRGDVISESNQQLQFAYFPEKGMVSIVAESPEGQVAEAGIIGREGFIHPCLVLGSDIVPFKIQVQMPGDAYRMPAADLLAATKRSSTLRDTLLLFTHLATVQGSFSTLSNAVHQVEERLARWLLMCHDRSDSDDLAITHEFLGIMLAVRRASVTTSLHVLEGEGFIESARGYITIRNRVALEAFAADAYGKPEAEYRRLLGPL